MRRLRRRRQLDFALPNGCALSQGGAAVQTGENGSLIHWIALCPDTDPADMPQLFASASAKQGWVTATAPAAHFDAYRRGDLELLLEFTATNYVWFGERYWR